MLPTERSGSKAGQTGCTGGEHSYKDVGSAENGVQFLDITRAKYSHDHTTSMSEEFMINGPIHPSGPTYS